MKGIERGSVKYLIALIIAIAIFGIILYPLFDLIICKFITNSEFVYSISEYIVKPVTFGCISGILLWVLDRKTKVNKKFNINFMKGVCL